MKEKKTCTRCNKVKEMSEFSKDRTKADRHCYWCKSCYKDYRKEKKGKGRVMKRAIVQLTHFWAKELGVTVTEIKFRKYSRSLARATKRNWVEHSGEITYHKHISRMLTRKQQSCLALHEVAHLVVPGIHNKEWKAMMSKHMPNWRKIDKKMDDRVWISKYYNRRL